MSTLSENQKILFFKLDLHNFMKKTHIMTRDYDLTIEVTHKMIRNLAVGPLRLMPEHLRDLFSERDLDPKERLYKKNFMVAYYRHKGYGVLKIAKLLQMSPNTIQNMVKKNELIFFVPTELDNKLLQIMDKWYSAEYEMERNHYTML